MASTWPKVLEVLEELRVLTVAFGLDNVIVDSSKSSIHLGVGFQDLLMAFVAVNQPSRHKSP